MAWEIWTCAGFVWIGPAVGAAQIRLVSSSASGITRVTWIVDEAILQHDLHVHEAARSASILYRARRWEEILRNGSNTLLDDFTMVPLLP
jgi:hypothetical protein